MNPRSALLSNFEVLTLLKELENDHLERSKTAMRIKKEEDSLSSSTSIGAAGGTQHTYHHNTNYLPDISENLRTIQVEVRCFLPQQLHPEHQNLRIIIRQFNIFHLITFPRIHNPPPEFLNSSKISHRTILPKPKNYKS